ncbi:hypothetical protein HNY73_001861 [Argiope bruennichi]|uniref:Uncharacterized protein n=1 Tax=Argiope bruennichi TaxID=94029 RepID=A0A8T0FYA6_ARGBR|nr:hypothetical protein HNY73_001861 [Argiope bruennichi]
MCKRVFEGMTTQVPVKFKPAQTLYRTPLLITTNKSLWWHDQGRHCSDGSEDIDSTDAPGFTIDYSPSIDDFWNEPGTSTGNTNRSRRIPATIPGIYSSDCDRPQFAFGTRRPGDQRPSHARYRRIIQCTSQIRDLCVRKFGTSILPLQVDEFQEKPEVDRTLSEPSSIEDWKNFLALGETFFTALNII